MWNIQKIVKKGEYNYAVVPEHPNAIRHGYVLHHRVVMENHLGRLLNDGEVVHHIDGNKRNNKIDNLKIMSYNEHSAFHSRAGKKMVKCCCPYCETIFIREYRQTHLAKGNKATFCSRRCNGKFYNSYLETHMLENAISVNIIEIFYDNTEET